VLAEHADPLAPPLLARRHAVYDAGREVAKLEVSRSLRPLLLHTSLVLAVALLAAGLAVLALRVLPMRAVDRAHAALERTEAERRRLQERLLHAEKLESVGRLAGGVAHDFNNILTVILSFARELTEELAGEPREQAREIERAALRGAAVTRQLLAFGRKQVLYPEVLKMEEVVAGLGSMIGRLVGERVTVALDVAPDVGLVRMDPTQLEQAIVNLSLNARDAMPDGGRLSIGARNVDVAPGADAAAGSAPGQYVAVSVRDTGTGMDATTLSRIFEPFYTTKPMGKGTGLGLSIVHGAVEQSGGHIGVESTPGAGTAFTLYLPRAAAA
jgi:signal transduction histidine kinase